MASWSGTTGITSYATKKQLISSVSGIYNDLQDISGFELQNVKVSTLLADQWISTPELYVSSIFGAGITVDGGTIVISTGDFSLVQLSTLSFKGLDLGGSGIDFSFDLGLGDAVGGFLGGIGGAVGGAFIGLGTGTGLAIKGVTNGLFSLANTRDSIYLNSNVFETVNGTSQIQISTLGDAYPLYSSIFRSVSSVSADSVPGAEILLSTLFYPGTTCIRTVSDPLTPLTTDSNILTSTVQSFSQWVPFTDPTPTGEDIFGRYASFSTLTLNTNYFVDGLPVIINMSNGIGNPLLEGNTTYQPETVAFPIPYTPNPPIEELAFFQSGLWSNNVVFPFTIDYISSAFAQFQSTITIGTTYYIRSTISSPALFTWQGIGIGNFAICEPDETGFRSTATLDFAAPSNDLTIQWGLAVDNRNSTIGAGTAKRVEWDNDANTSNFYDIPVPVSTVVNTNLLNTFQINQSPYETSLLTQVSGSGNGFYIQANTMRVGGGINTSASNTPGYNYQFDGSMYIDGVLEATVIIAQSSIVSISTQVQSFFSTVLLEADEAIIPDLTVSSIKAYTSNITVPDPIVFQSNVNMGSYQFQPGTNLTVTNATTTLITISPSNVTIPDLLTTTLEASNITTGSLTAGTLVYSNAVAPYLETSTIEFGYTGNFSAPPPDYSLSMNVETPVGLAYTSYVAASNQVVNIMNFSNTVQMATNLFSTPLAYLQTSFGGSNIEGWASTIFFSPFTTPASVYLISGAGNGTLSLQAPQTTILNAFFGGDPTAPRVTIPAGSTYQFISFNGNWTTTSNPPPAPASVYNNNLKMWMDYENVNISTTDTLNLCAEKINLLGQTGINLLQASNIQATSVTTAGTAGYGFNTLQSFTGNPGLAPPVFGLNVQNTISTVSLLNKNLTLPGRGFNLFNSYNVPEWNNVIWNIDTVPTVIPQVIVGEVVRTAGGIQPYSAQFWLNNTIDSVPNATPIYQNVQGVLSTIGVVTGNTIALVQTTNGTNWSFTSNVPSPQGVTSNVVNNFYTVAMNNSLVNLGSGMPIAYTAPTLTYNTNKVFFFSPQIRVATMDAPSFASREAGFEALSYFDSNIIFSYCNANNWQSSALNPIINYAGNSYFSLAGWMPNVWISRIRTNDRTVYDIDIVAVAYPVGGTATDFIWGSQRFIEVDGSLIQPQADIRENYLMIPKNYFNFTF